MVRIELYTDGESTWSYYGKDEEWKSYVVGEDFDNIFVITGNRDFIETVEAKWWNRAKTILNDLDNYEPIPGSVFNFYTEEDEVSHEQRKAILKVYEDCYSIDDAETILKVANILYPEEHYVSRCIRGCCQRDWQYVYCAEKWVDLIDDLEAWYFGDITEIHWEDEENEEDMWCPIINDKLWQLKKEPDFKKALLEYLGEPTDLECEIYEQNGYTKVTNWKQIC
jgi:hypothetical protein